VRKMPGLSLFGEIKSSPLSRRVGRLGHAPGQRYPFWALRVEASPVMAAPLWDFHGVRATFDGSHPMKDIVSPCAAKPPRENRRISSALLIRSVALRSAPLLKDVSLARLQTGGLIYPFPRRKATWEGVNAEPERAPPGAQPSMFHSSFSENKQHDRLWLKYFNLFKLFSNLWGLRFAYNKIQKGAWKG